MKKIYVTPKLKSEKVELGVFGNYGCGSGNETGHHGRWWHWLFGRR